MASTGSTTCCLTSGCEHGLEVDVPRVLGGDHDGVDADRPVLVVVLDGDLGLAVGTEVGHRAVTADLGEPLRARRWAIEIGSGMSSGVSSQA